MSKTHLQLETEARDRRIASEQAEARLNAAAPRLLEKLKAATKWITDSKWNEYARCGFSLPIKELKEKFTEVWELVIECEDAIPLAERGKP